MPPSLISDCTQWGRIHVSGDDRQRFLQGLTTINVDKLDEGMWAWGAILNPKGRVLAVIQLGKVGEALVLACESTVVDATSALLERYAVMDDVRFARATGPAYRVWSSPESVWTAGLVEAELPGFAASTAEVERLRILAGLPAYGIDVDDENFPFETPLARVLDYQKGCYVGQEPVFRVHAQGGAAKTLRGLVFRGGDDGVAPGATVEHAARANAGAITSVSRMQGRPTIALAYLHRSVWDVGGDVRVGAAAAVVVELPTSEPS